MRWWARLGDFLAKQRDLTFTLLRCGEVKVWQLRVLAELFEESLLFDTPPTSHENALAGCGATRPVTQTLQQSLLLTQQNTVMHVTIGSVADSFDDVQPTR